MYVVIVSFDCQDDIVRGGVVSLEAYERISVAWPQHGCLALLDRARSRVTGS